MNAANDPRADLALVGRAVGGDPAAREELIRRMACIPPMLAVKNRRLGGPFDGHALQDLVQETSIAVWRRLPDYEGLASLETWIYAFCVRTLMASLRGRRRRPALRPLPEHDEIPDPARPPVSRLDYERLHEGLEHLDDVEARILRMKHFQGLTFEDAAARLGISPNTAKTQYYRGLRKLEEFLRAKHETEEASS